MSIIKDASLAPSGILKIEWVKQYMPILNALEEEFIKTKPFAGKKISVSIHLEAKTARLCLLLASGGAEVHATGSNPLSTRDDIAAALVSLGINVYAWYNASEEEYFEHCKQTLSCCPDIVIDDGGDLLNLLHGEMAHCAKNVVGGCEETTTGVLRMRARAAQGKLNFAMIAVNDAKTKHLFDNRFGTGQSALDGIIRTTNLVIAGKNVVVSGFGLCGIGIAERAKGMGANVIVTEVDSIAAAQAIMQGYSVMPMAQAAPIGDLFITVTGCKDVIIKDHFNVMKTGALLCNAGHFDTEVDVKGLKEIAVSSKKMRENVVGYTLKNGRTLMVLGEGRLVNLACGDGHPAEIMDMSFAVQALCALHLNSLKPPLSPAVYDVLEEIDQRVGQLKIQTLGMAIDTLTQEQREYLSKE